MKHSTIAGSSTAGRLMACNGSAALVAKMPPQPPSKYAEAGTKLHSAIEIAVDGGDISHFNLDEDEQAKIDYCLRALDEIDPKQEMIYTLETKVEFTGVAALDGVFGYADLMGCIGKRAVVLDWKFGDGVAVSAEENTQGLFLAAAARRSASWVFKDATEVEIIIVQPPFTRRWVTTIARLAEFEADLIEAVKASQKPDAPLVTGGHCRWCPAKPICPQMTGAVDRAMKTSLDNLPVEQIGAYLQNAEMLEKWIEDLRALAQQMLEKNVRVPGYKLVNKRAVRSWTDPDKAQAFLESNKIDPLKHELISPAAAEKLLKKSKVTLPDDLVAAVSSGTTIASESDPRPEVVQIGATLVAALSKLQ